MTSDAENVLLQRTRPDPVGAEYGRQPEDLPPADPGSAGYVQQIVVLVTKDGGASGGEFAECTYTYTVKDLDDSTVLKKNAAGDAATAMTPKTPRHHYIEYWYAGETRDAPAETTSRYALAFYDASGDLHLLVCFGEFAKDNPC